MANDSIWAAMDQARRDGGMAFSDVIPEKAFTVHEYAERYGLPRNTAKYQLQRLVDGGSLASGINRERRGSRTYLTRFYWLPEPPPKANRKRKG